MERTLTHRPRGGFILTPLCSNTNSAERKSCPSGEGEGRVVCGVWEPNLRSTGRVGPRLPARQGDGTKGDTVRGPAARVGPAAAGPPARADWWGAVQDPNPERCRGRKLSSRGFFLSEPQLPQPVAGSQHPGRTQMRPTMGAKQDTKG